MLRLRRLNVTPVQPTPTPTPQPLDFALLQPLTSGQSQRSRRMLWLMLGLLGLVVASVVTLVLYLSAYERGEEERRRVADAQWLEQSVRFHFTRLEDDLQLLARQAVQNSTPQLDMQGGLLWNEPGALLWHGWLPRHQESTVSAAGTTGNTGVQNRWQADANAHPANAEMLASMLDIAVGLRRSAYGGPMRAADGHVTDVVWLAVPLFERGQFMGNYVAALSMQTCVQGLVPVWFNQQHTVRLVQGDTPVAPTQDLDSLTYLAAMNLPGADVFIEMAPLNTQPAMVPRLFLSLALLFLLGMLVSLAALRRDMGKRQHVQAQLEAQVSLRTAMEKAVTVGLRAWTNQGQILYVNEAFCRMVGYSAAELVGRSAPLPYWPPEHTAELNTVHRSIISQGTQTDGVEVQFQHRSGRRVDVLIHEAPLTTASGEQIGWMSSVLDISERKRAQRLAAAQQARLEASGRLVAMGEVASTLAHELNQPLGALSSFANGLLNRLRAGNISLMELEPVVERMARLSDKAGGILLRVNAFARRRELSRQRLDLCVFVRQSVRHHVGGHATVSLLPLPDEAGLWIQADDLLLEHVVSNLLNNAQEWSRHGQQAQAQVRVWISVDAEHQQAGLHVADNGPGVSDEDREHIFSAFYSTQEGGMGMGLAICRSIVEAHHGRLEVSRDSTLGGACFTVWLPLSSADRAQPPATDGLSD
ncbi:MAG: hypothetical protein RLZZ352_1065 [Pseudomonadota bacterium]|jgi:two-component system sensor histidine kinase DctS